MNDFLCIKCYRTRIITAIRHLQFRFSVQTTIREFRRGNLSSPPRFSRKNHFPQDTFWTLQKRTDVDVEMQLMRRGKTSFLVSSRWLFLRRLKRRMGRKKTGHLEVASLNILGLSSSNSSSCLQIGVLFWMIWDFEKENEERISHHNVWCLR